MTNAQINVAIYHVTGKNLDYVGCLNAMHEAEKELVKKQKLRFAQLLEIIVETKGLKTFHPNTMILISTEMDTTKATIGRFQKCFTPPPTNAPKRFCER